MIKLDIPVFCDNCGEIKPYAESEEVMFKSIDGTRMTKTVTSIKCKHENRCRNIYSSMDNLRRKNELYNEVIDKGGDLI